MSTIVIVIIAVLVFSFLIFIHELGHFLAAKWAGIKVNGFSLGMGPAILSFERGGTLYALRLDAGRQTVVTLHFLREAFGYRQPVFPKELLDAFLAKKLAAAPKAPPQTGAQNAG